MKIDREDVNRMRDLARKIAGIRKNPVLIHQLEHGFVDYMTVKYGKQTAVTMLTQVWKLAAKLTPVPEN